MNRIEQLTKYVTSCREVAATYRLPGATKIVPNAAQKAKEFDDLGDGWQRELNAEVAKANGTALDWLCPETEGDRLFKLRQSAGPEKGILD